MRHAMNIQIGDPVLIMWGDKTTDLGFVTAFGERKTCSVRFGKRRREDDDEGVWIEKNIPLDICQRLVVEAA